MTANLPKSGRRLDRALHALLGLALAVLVTAMACSEPPPATTEPPPPVEVTTSVDRAVATTGDIITYTVTVEYDPQYEIDLPEPGAEIAGFRVVDLGREEPREVEGRKVEERWYQLRADLVGSYVLPPLRLTYRPAGDQESGEEPGEGEARDEVAPTTLETSSIFVEVESVLPADGEVTDIRGPKPLRVIRQGINWPLWGGVALGAAVLAGALVFFWRRSRRPVYLPPAPPHEIAFQALDELRQTDFHDLEAVRRYYYSISQVVRNYVENRFGLNATDLTTEEIWTASETMEELKNSEGDRLRVFLTDTDSVKFAAHVPSESEIGETYERALGFVEATKEADPEAPEEAVQA